MANNLTFEQSAIVLNNLFSQATGKTGIAPVDEANFVSVATTTLKCGYNQVIDSLSVMFSDTIFSDRAYSGKFAGIRADARRWGNAVRKLTSIDREWEDDERYEIVDGDPIDHYKVKKPSVLQTNYYGGTTVQEHITIFKDQLDTAFTSSEEFGRFISMVMQNINDRITQKHEITARNTLANFIAGKVSANNGVINLVSVYNDLFGTELTTDTVRKPENWQSFSQWMFGYIKTLCDRMTERSEEFHINIAGKAVNRHTPYDKMKFYMYSDIMNDITNRVIANTFNEQFLNRIDYEPVNYWQSIKSPDGIQVKPIYLNTDGTLTQPAEEVTVSDIVGVVFDEEALGYTTINQYMLTTPMNAAGAYHNIYWHFTERYWNDFTENGLIFLLK